MALYLFVTVELVGVGDDIIIRYYSLFIYTHLFHYVAQNSYNACCSILAAYHMAFGGFHRSGTDLLGMDGPGTVPASCTCS